MRISVLSLILAVGPMLVVSPDILAQTAAPSATARPQPASHPADLTGIWLKARSEPTFRFSMEDPPLAPWALEIYRRNRQGLQNPREQGLDELDPYTYCYPMGPTRLMLAGFFHFEIVQLPAKIMLVFEVSNGVRQIFMDGRGHPDGWPFGWMGHSTGRWDGDTLVVDSVGLNDKTWLDIAGPPHSNALHVVERFRRPSRETLEVEFLFEDPKAFTKPWGAKRQYQLRPNAELLEFIVCEDQLKMGQ